VIRRAEEQLVERAIEEKFEDEVTRWLSTPIVAGARAAHCGLASAYGVNLTSPFLDRRVVELVLGTPAKWMLWPVYKGALRNAAAGVIPEEVRIRGKDVDLPTSLLRRIVTSRASREALRNQRVRHRLGDWIRFDRVEGLLDAIDRGYNPGDPTFWQQVEGLVSFAYWYARASREYGVT
jgi:asparagine synthetase B (glutamine-hydrolysing)